MTTLRPSDVHLGVIPLVGTLGRAELEHAAALLVRACQLHEDKWQPVSLEMVGATIAHDSTNLVGALPFWITNPFMARPDFYGLLRRGYATRDPPDASTPDELARLILSDKAMQAFAKHKVQPS